MNIGVDRKLLKYHVNQNPVSEIPALYINTSTFGHCQSIEPSLSFKIDSQLRVYENWRKLSPAVFKDVIYLAENYHRGGETLPVDPDEGDGDQPKNDFGDLYAYNNKTGKLQWVI